MATTTNYGWTTPDDTDLVKDGAAAIRTLGSSVDTTTKNLNPETTAGDISYRSATANVNTRLPLGTAGQVLKVNSGATAPEWATDTSGMTNPMTTTGDTIYSSSGSTPARLAIGSTGHVLTVAGGVPTWAAPAGGGKVLQVVYAMYDTETNINTSSFTDTGLTASITPSATSSKVLVFANSGVYGSKSASNSGGIACKLFRGATEVFSQDATYLQALFMSVPSGSGVAISGYIPLQYLDSPSTTSSTTYKIQGASGGNSSFQRLGMKSNMILMEIGV